MTKKNPYENQKDTLDIPDFFEEKTSEATDSNTVDMSIFKMSDEELYDDVSDNEDLDTLDRSSRKLNVTALLGLLVMLLLLATCVGSLLYAYSQHKAYVNVNTKYNQILANQDAYKQQIAEKDALIENLYKQIEDIRNTSNPYVGVYEVVDGPISFRTSAQKSEDNTTTYNSNDTAENGERFSVIEVTRDFEGYYWAKLADNVYFCIGTSDDVWARKVD